MLSALKTLFHREEGASLVEYALLIALVALVALTAITTIGNHLSSLFNSTAGSV
jgi:pilus assembly protein Flp/PilA